MVSGGEVVLHEAWREAPEVMWRGRLIERRRLLVGRKGSSKVGGSLQKCKGKHSHSPKCSTVRT